MSEKKNGKQLSPKRLYKMDLKRYGIYLLVIIPIALGASVLWSWLCDSKALATFLVVLTGLFFVLGFEGIYYLVKRHQEKQSENKVDPFGEQK